MSYSYSTFSRAAFAAALALCALAAAAAPTLAPIPSAPAYGQAVQLQLRDLTTSVYLPATRYSRNGNNITMEFETVAPTTPATPELGVAAIDFGELAPGNYSLEARFYDIAHPTAMVTSVSSGMNVAGPQDWGLYSVPQQPNALEPVQIAVNSAAFFDPTTLRATQSGNVIRVDFDYYSHSPTIWNNPPPGAVSLASVAVGGLLPGSYRIEGWGRAKDTGVAERYFTRDMVVASTAWVIEYYSVSMNHYFMTANPGDIAQLDAGVVADFKRTGHRFKAWLRAQDGPAGVMPVCRFYAAGPSSHFYSVNAGDCEFLRQLEQTQRAQAQAAGKPFLGWSYEGTAFYSLPPQNGVCAGGTVPVYRAYNRGITGSNHRFMRDAQQRAAMLVGWADEGVAFCAPG